MLQMQPHTANDIRQLLAENVPPREQSGVEFIEFMEDGVMIVDTVSGQSFLVAIRKMKEE